MEVEVDVANSVPNISIVGLPDNAVSEARERVHSAIKNSGYSFPLGRVIVNLAPADIRKEGTNFDLPIAIGILKEQGIDIKDDLNTGFIGELSLDGSLRKINGVLPLVSGLKDSGVTTVFVPSENAKEAALVQGVRVYGAKHLGDIVNHYLDTPIGETKVDINEYLESNAQADFTFDFKDVKGQQKAKKALEIAKENAKRLNLKNVEFLQSDLYENLKDAKIDRFDVIISNPPYIPKSQKMEKSVVDYEPHVALFGGDDGLFFYRKIMENAHKVINPHSFLAFEIGYDEKQAICALVEQYFPNDRYEVLKDLNGKDRMLFIYHNL